MGLESRMWGRSNRAWHVLQQRNGRWLPAYAVPTSSTAEPWVVISAPRRRAMTQRVADPPARPRSSAPTLWSLWSGVRRSRPLLTVPAERRSASWRLFYLGAIEHERSLDAEAPWLSRVPAEEPEPAYVFPYPHWAGVVAGGARSPRGDRWCVTGCRRVPPHPMQDDIPMGRRVFFAPDGTPAGTYHRGYAPDVE